MSSNENVDRAFSRFVFYITLHHCVSPFVPPHPFPTMADGHLLQVISLEPLHPLLTDPGRPGTLCSPTQVP